MSTEPATALSWNDPKRYLWVLGAIIPLLPLSGAHLVQVTGYGIFWWYAPFFVYVIIPLLDRVIGEDAENPPDEAIVDLERDRYYRWVTYAFIPVQYAVLIWGCWVFATWGLRWWEAAGLIVSVGGVGGIGINAAHEMGHKKGALERWLSRITLAQVAYGHFYVEHNKGHHRRVATPEDPASSRLGESFWEFLPRTVIGSLRSAWEIEGQRLQRIGKPVFSIHNEILQAWSMTVILYAGLCLAFGPITLLFLIPQAVYGFSLLEVVNYIEHYGLVRQKDASGRYERVRPEHSWNSNHVVTNLFLYHLQRHSDHHANPTRRYQALRHFDKTPQLPSGYAGMVVLAYFPPLWRRVMDKRVLEHYEGDVTRANIHPPRRESILERFGRTEAHSTS